MSVIEETEHHDRVFTLDPVLSPAEGQAQIERAHEHGFREAPITLRTDVM